MGCQGMGDLITEFFRRRLVLRMPSLTDAAFLLMIRSNGMKKRQDAKKADALPLARGEWVRVSDVVKMTGMSDGWIRNGIDTGSLPFNYYRPCSGKIQFDSADIEDWVRSICIKAGT
jgi:predicted DNA-binding transcriptional regulator AlpA